MNIFIDNNQYFRKDLPNLKTGDKVEVITKIFDNVNNKFRIIHFKGIITSQKQKKTISYNFSVLKESNKIVINCLFSYNSPNIIKIEKLGHIPKVRRAKLNYLVRKLYSKKYNE